MKRLIPSPSMAVALLALFVAMGGSSYAAVKLQRGSVTSREIRDRSVRLADLDPAIRPTKSSALFRAAVTDVVSTDQVLAALSGAVKGQPGDPGTPGAAGAAGPQGPSGTATVTTREAFGPTVGASQHTGALATCQPGEKVVGGGARYEGAPAEAIMQFSVPDPQGWSADFVTAATAGTSGRAHVFVLCAAA
jgi:hypothetical protein